MGIEIDERYTFIGKTEQIKPFYDFLKQYDMEQISSAYMINSRFRQYLGDTAENENKKLVSSDEYYKMVFALAEKFDKAIDTQYPIDRTKIKDTHLGWFMVADILRESDGYACFACGLDNRNSISAYIFKELLEKHFPGVFMYFRYSGDSSMFNTFCTNDKDMRFYAYPEHGQYYLRDGWNEISVLYDGFYSKKEIADSYRLFLGNPDINPDFLPVFCGTQPLHDDQYPIEDIQVAHEEMSEPPIEICHKFCTNKNGKNKFEEMAKFHGLKPEWQNVAQRTIDYDKYPELKGCPHINGTRDDGTPYLYRTVAYDLEVRIPTCITDFDENAFDWDVLYDSACRLNQGERDYTLILSEVQKPLVNIKKAASFFHSIKTECGEILYERKEDDNDNCNIDTNDWSEDIPF